MADTIFTELRAEYAGAPLDETAVAADPVEQFRRWFDDVRRSNIRLANAMTLATVDAHGQPSARIVLLKELDERGFVFFTGYTSRKARELEDNPRVALVFWWEPLDRQVRVEGTVERVSAQVSDAYFASRPRASNLSAMASPQSEPVTGRAWLEARVATLDREWAGKELVRPETWGGYRVVPSCIEFWQGRPDRLHDRVRYTLEDDNAWAIERLAP